MSEYPQHDRLREVADVTQGIHDFCELLGERGFHLSRWLEQDGNRTGFWSIIDTMTRDDLMAESVGLDLKALEVEKEQMLAEIRSVELPSE